MESKESLKESSKSSIKTSNGNARITTVRKILTEVASREDEDNDGSERVIARISFY